MSPSATSPRRSPAARSSATAKAKRRRSSSSLTPARSSRGIRALFSGDLKRALDKLTDGAGGAKSKGPKKLAKEAYEKLKGLLAGPKRGVEGDPRRALGGRDRAPDSDAPTIRNEKLAGDVHPETGVRFKENGYPDFSRHADEAAQKLGKPTTVQVQGLTGKSGDAALANGAAGFEKTPPGYVWHHHEDGRTMQLVPAEIHRKTGHTGGAAYLKRGISP